MIIIQGKGASTGVVTGPIYFFIRQDSAVTKYAADPASEKERLAHAQEATISQLKAFAEKAR